MTRLASQLTFLSMKRELLKNALLGAAAGVAGVFFMRYGPKLVPPIDGPEPEDQRHDSEPATEKLAARVLSRFGVALEGEQKKRLGQLVHYGTGASWGAAYGLLRSFIPGTPLASGALLGFLLWLGFDETAVPLLKLSEKPGDYSVKAHAMALSSHLVYGTTTDAVFRVVTAL